MKRVNYHYEESLYEKTVVVQHLHPNGNGFVYVAGIPGYDADERGLVNIREASEEELRKIIADSIKALSEGAPEPQAVVQKFVNARWRRVNPYGRARFWNLYHGLNLEESFGDYNEADVYLIEEEFKSRSAR